VQKYAFFGPLRRAWDTIREVPVTMQIVLVAMAVLCLAMSFLLIPLIGDRVLKPAVDAVLNGTGYSSYLGGL
jgi:hypothetical protein